MFRSREHFRERVLQYVETPGARALKALGFTPNKVTLLGFGITVGAAALVGAGYLLAGGILFFAANLLDLMDGALARHTNQVSPFGALLDSVLDRLGESALFVGLAVFGVREYAIREPDSVRLMLLIVSLVLALALSQAVSYARARGESLGIDTRIGLITRPERIVILSVFIAISLPVVALIGIAALSLITLLQRLYHIWVGLKSR
jgi:CDP-diacylglycerol--glycerol-3-phosphate 3-phosphatidyltransferase